MVASSIGNLNIRIVGRDDFSASAALAEKSATGLILKLESQIAAYNIVGRSVESYELALQGASRETIAQVEALQREVAAIESHNALMQHGARLTEQSMTLDERRRQRISQLNTLLSAGAISQATYNRQLQSLNALQQVAASQMGRMSGSANRATFAVQQLAFGAQDAATVFGTMGLAGAVRASSNNVIQFASLLGPLYGTIAALAGTGIALLVDYWDRSSKAAKKAIQYIDDYSARLGRLSEQLRDTHFSLDFDVNIGSSLEEIRSAAISANRAMASVGATMDITRKKMDVLFEGQNLPQHFANALRNPEDDPAMHQRALLALKEFVPDKERREAIKKESEALQSQQRERERLSSRRQELVSTESQREKRDAEQRADDQRRAKENARRKEMEDAAKASEENQRKILDIENGTRREINPGQSRRADEIKAVRDRLTARQEDIKSIAGLETRQREDLLRASADAADAELKRIEHQAAKEHEVRFASGATKGSQEDFKARHADIDHKDSVPEDTKKLLDNAKAQTKVLRQQLDEAKKQRQRVVVKF